MAENTLKASNEASSEEEWISAGPVSGRPFDLHQKCHSVSVLLPYLVHSQEQVPSAGLSAGSAEMWSWILNSLGS